MATEGERPRADLIQQLEQEPYRFDFFQAVRLLEYAARAEERSASRPVGRDNLPSAEVVRFRALPSLTFPAGEVADIRVPDDEQPPEMTVSFMGLTGPAGVLPQHYTSLVIERAHSRYKDRAMLEFFDLFNHRTISLFYRAWEKYRFPFAYERSRLASSRAPDPFTFCLYCLTGLGEETTRDRSAFADELVLFYGGHFARRPRSATGLRQILSDYAENSVEVREFVGQWLYLDASSQTRMPSAREPEGRNLALGVSTVVGSRVWDVQSRFRVSIGPLTHAEFREFLPSGRKLRQLCDLVRLYAGPEFDFDVQLVLRSQDVPSTQLGTTQSGGSRLGWDTWIQSRTPVNDAGDAVFRFDAFG